MIARDLKMEAPLRTIVVVCKAACPRLSSGSREQFLQNYDKTRRVLGRGLERLMAGFPFSFFSHCDQFSYELGRFRLTERQGIARVTVVCHLRASIQSLCGLRL